jgi:hypothetical protein
MVKKRGPGRPRMPKKDKTIQVCTRMYRDELEFVKSMDPAGLGRITKGLRAILAKAGFAQSRTCQGDKLPTSQD